MYQDRRPEDVLGVFEEFDLDELISAVYLGPRTKDEFLYDVAVAIMDKFNLRKSLERSVLLVAPRNDDLA